MWLLCCTEPVRRHGSSVWKGSPAHTQPGKSQKPIADSSLHSECKHVAGACEVIGQRASSEAYASQKPSGCLFWEATPLPSLGSNEAEAQPSGIVFGV